MTLLRVCQGIAIGGEWGGAALMALEHSEKDKRGFSAAFANAGAPTGTVLGTIAMTVMATLPEHQFLTWGWRVPFFVSGILLIFGLYIRAQIAESPLFVAEAERRERNQEGRAPIFAILANPKPVIYVALAGIAAMSVTAMLSTFGITLAVLSGVTRSEALTAFGISQFLAIFTVLFYARLSDRVGRRPVMLAGVLGLGVVAYPTMLMVSSGHFGTAVAGFVLALSVCQAACFGPMVAFISEQFGTSSRYTGASLGYQLSGLVGAGFAPVIAASLYAASNSSISVVAAYLVVVSLISAVFIVLVRESKDNDLVPG
ncbi:MFS transporter [Rhodococcus sp. (in: high G+C Gram-positive bacteria)]|uniref:MFS transporter n=1 Tax=Rhodococcus sp. TaxID=1831 RepID=UPI003BAF8C9F